MINARDSATIDALMGIPTPATGPATTPAALPLVMQQHTVARLVDVTVRTLERWRAVGAFPPPDFWKSGRAFYRRETVLNWIETQAAGK